MPQLRDRAAIRALLTTDRPWSVYALGDLAPGFFEQCSWFVSETRPPGLALLFRGFTVPVLLAFGPASAIAALMDEIAVEPALYLHVRPEIVPVLQTRYRIPHPKSMWRMVLELPKFHPEPIAGVNRLGAADLPALNQLYDDGKAAGEVPEFFFASMLEQGVFFGIHEKNDLVAVAGTHLVAPPEGVAAVGNIYTRRDHRGRGLAARVTSAVVSQLLRMEIDIVALNVNQQNLSAIKVYSRLGFARYGEFIEGAASRL
jgi:ribosomal protein S18 acetylase RimI-like enzyme